MAQGRARRGGVALLVVLVAIGGIALGGRALWRAAQTAIQSDGCDFGSARLTLTRSQNAAEMVSVVIKRNLPERAAVLLLGAALQESKLDNIPAGDGDRDSVGVLQQRPSQGWGPAASLADVRYASGRFLDVLVKVPKWQTDSLASVVQQVQVSADGSAYAQHEPEAQALADGLMGVTPAGVSCDFSKPTAVAPAATVAAALSTQLPVSAPAVSGRTITVPGASWPTAAWLIAHANTYGIDSVACKDKTWTRAHGWKAAAGTTSGVVATMAT